MGVASWSLNTSPETGSWDYARVSCCAVQWLNLAELVGLRHRLKVRLERDQEASGFASHTHFDRSVDTQRTRNRSAQGHGHIHPVAIGKLARPKTRDGEPLSALPPFANE